MTMEPFATTGRLLLFLAVLGLLLIVKDAAAQERARGATSRTEQRASERSDARVQATERATSEGEGRAPSEPEVQAEARRNTGRVAAPGRDQDERRERAASPAREARSSGRAIEEARPRGGSGRGGVIGPARPPVRRGREVHPAPPVRVQPVVRVDLVWPWEYRYRRKWAPRYQYRQVVFVELGWGRRQRASRIEVRTFYRHHVRRANPHRAEVDVVIDRIELYDRGRYLGAVEHIPSSLARVRATLYRDGRVTFDREVFLVGDPYVGFEMISTRNYGRPVWDAYHPKHGVRVGALDLRRQRARVVRFSRLFDPYRFEGHVPISLLPDQYDLLYDYGPRGVSGRYYEDYNDYGEGYYYGYEGAAPRGLAGRGTYAPGGRAGQPLHAERSDAFTTEKGAQIRFKRDVELTRLE
jgi:hypothetical protein